MKSDSPHPRPPAAPPTEPGLAPASAPPASDLKSPPPAKAGSQSRGFWSEVWRRYRQRYVGLAALIDVAILTLIAMLSPVIAGTKPVICRYKGRVYLPALGYFYEPW